VKTIIPGSISEYIATIGRNLGLIEPSLSPATGYFVLCLRSHDIISVEECQCNGNRKTALRYGIDLKQTLPYLFKDCTARQLEG